MKVLVCGGTYLYITDKADPSSMRLSGGAMLSTLIASHSHHEVHLHTNFSTEEERITKSYQKMLRNHWVQPNDAAKISSPYGRMSSKDLIPGSNVFETSGSVTDSTKYQSFDCFVITTDISERDFRKLSRYAFDNGIETIVVTANEYPPPVVYHGTTVISLPVEEREPENGAVSMNSGRRTDEDISVSEDGSADEHPLSEESFTYKRRASSDEAVFKSEGHININRDHRGGQPVYHEYLTLIKDELHKAGLIEASKVIRHQRKPKPPVKRLWMFILQLIAAGMIITGIVLSVLYLFDYFSSRDVYETVVDDSMPVESDECSTVGKCRALGDAYLSELEEYIDIMDEPHMFIENRTRTNYIDYEIDASLNLGEADEENPLPVGSKESFEEIWERFSRIFPEEYLSDLDTFRLFSDGEGNVLAYVEIMDDSTTLAVDIRDNQNRASEYRTLIHEFGHIYSLPFDDFDQTCGAGTDLNCVKDDTVMSDYIDRFWTQYGEDWLENSEKSTFEREAFYNNHVTDFHVPYQATNAKEDYAVTFLRFIIEPMPEAESSQLKDIKVRSFYENSELVKLRVDILRNLVELEKEG